MKPVVIIAGPTAVGKTELTLQLAQKLGGEIVSSDSMQIYRRMDIGSAKPGAGELASVPHHLIDVAEPEAPFTVSDYRQLALAALRDIGDRGRVPIVSGGTGLYVNALLYEMDFSDTGSDPAYRKALEEEAARNGPETLHSRLTLLDPEAAAAIHPNNVKRVIRALEINEVGGGKKGDFTKNQRRNLEFSFLFVCLTRPRQELYDRINTRVDLMLAAGLLHEVETLRASGLTRGHQSMQGIGYKELLAHLEGECSLEAAVASIKQNTRHYAKRQLTWFKRYPEAHWLDLSGYPDAGGATAALYDLFHTFLPGGVL